MDCVQLVPVNQLTMRFRGKPGPGDPEYRKNLLEFFMKDEKLFNLANRRLGTKWHAVFQKEFLRKKDFDDDESNARTTKLDKKFNEFISNDLPLIHKHFETYWKL